MAPAGLKPHYTGPVPRIDDIFASLRSQGKRALMPFVCGGHPKPGLTGPLLLAMQEAGASIVEVGIPFSDPIADGPIIAAAMHDAIGAGATPRKIFDEVAAVRSQLTIGLVAMVSVSIVHRSRGGVEAFVREAAQAGFDGFIFPDVPLEESQPLRDAAAKAGCSAALLIAPTTPPPRAAEIAKASTGFVYVLARTGITGERADAPDVSGIVSRLRQATTLPLAVGFGISKPDHVRAVVKHADAAIVGSGLVRRLDQASKEGHDPVAAGRTFVAELATGLA